MTNPNKGKQGAIQMTIKRLSGYLTEKRVEMYLTECNTQELCYEHDVVGVEQLRTAPAKLNDLKVV